MYTYSITINSKGPHSSKSHSKNGYTDYESRPHRDMIGMVVVIEHIHIIDTHSYVCTHKKWEEKCTMFRKNLVFREFNLTKFW